jgi:hypothetical protein
MQDVWDLGVSNVVTVQSDKWNRLVSSQLAYTVLIGEGRVSAVERVVYEAEKQVSGRQLK